MGKRTFTYDHVFDSHVTQGRLYGDVARGMLTSFLEGYNATILAYGQTGSGKTFTMGSENTARDGGSQHDPERMGLIPRFMNDLFTALEVRKCRNKDEYLTSLTRLSPPLSPILPSLLFSYPRTTHKHAEW